MFTLWLLAALLVSPMSEKHHLALLLPAAAFALYATLDGTRTRWRESVAWGIAVATCILLSKPFPHGPFYFLAIAASFAWVVRMQRLLAATES